MQEQHQTSQSPLIFLHGIGGDSTHFTALIRQLGMQNCYALDLPGYGSTPSLGDDLSFASLCDWLADEISALNIASAHLVGHSLGGMLALEHAVRFPQQLNSLTMIGATSAFGGRDDQFRTQFLKDRLAPLDAGMSMKQMAALAIPELVGTAAEPSVSHTALQSMAQISPQQWRNVLSCLVSFNRRQEVAEIDIPVCVIAGSEDTNAPARTLQKMAGKFPDAEYYCLDGVGHLLPLEAPAKIGQIIQSFIGLK